MSRRPITLAEAEKRKLLVDEKDGILTFSNGTSWEYWAEPNCYRCKWWDPDAAGALCAFEGAALLHMVSPALAEMFGWKRKNEEAAAYYKEQGKPDDIRQWWKKPDECPFLKDRDDNSPDPPFIDPTQLTFLAPDEWPTVVDAPVIYADPALTAAFGEPVV